MALEPSFNSVAHFRLHTDISNELELVHLLPDRAFHSGVQSAVTRVTSLHYLPPNMRLSSSTTFLAPLLGLYWLTLSLFASVTSASVHSTLLPNGNDTHHTRELGSSYTLDIQSYPEPIKFTSDGSVYLAQTPAHPGLGYQGTVTIRTVYSSATCTAECTSSHTSHSNGHGGYNEEIHGDHPRPAFVEAITTSPPQATVTSRSTFVSVAYTPTQAAQTNKTDTADTYPNREDINAIVGDHPKLLPSATAATPTTNMSNLTMTTSAMSSVSRTIDTSTFLATTLTPSLSSGSSIDTVIDLAPSTTRSADASETTDSPEETTTGAEEEEEMTTDAAGNVVPRPTITSYKTVDAAETTDAEGNVQTDTPVLAGENGVAKLGAGAWTVAVLGFSTVIAGLLI